MDDQRELSNRRGIDWPSPSHLFLRPPLLFLSRARQLVTGRTDHLPSRSKNTLRSGDPPQPPPPTQSQKFLPVSHITSRSHDQPRDRCLSIEIWNMNCAQRDPTRTKALLIPSARIV